MQGVLKYKSPIPYNVPNIYNGMLRFTYKELKTHNIRLYKSIHNPNQ